MAGPVLPEDESFLSSALFLAWGLSCFFAPEAHYKGRPGGSSGRFKEVGKDRPVSVLKELQEQGNLSS